MKNLKNCTWEVPWSILEYYTGLFLEALRKNMKIRSQRTELYEECWKGFRTSKCSSTPGLGFKNSISFLSFCHLFMI